MADPVDELANDAQRFAATEGLRWIPREFLVGDVGVVLELPSGLDDVDAPAAIAGGKFGTPNGGVESCAEVDVVHHSVCFEVRFATRDQQLAHRQVSLRTVQVHACLVHLERHRLTYNAHAPMLATRLAGAKR